MKQTHKTYGLVIALIMVVFNVVMYITGMAFKQSALSYLGYLPFLIGIIMNANAFSKANDGYVTFGNVFSSGFKASAIITIILLAWTLLSIFVIFPEMKDKAMEMAMEKMAENPDMGEEELEMGVSMMKKFFVPTMIGGIVFGTMFFGAIFSLIGAAIAKKKGAAPAGMM